MRVVLGCGNFGGIGSAPAFFGQGETREQAFDLMDAAWALGLDRFDTADAYGGGRSEAWIGDWIAATGNRPRITSKTFNAMGGGGDFGLAPQPGAPPGRDHRPLPDARTGSGHAGRGDVRPPRGPRRAAADRRLGREQRRRRRPAPVARARDSLARAELVLAAGARRRAGGDSAV